MSQDDRDQLHHAGLPVSVVEKHQEKVGNMNVRRVGVASAVALILGLGFII